MEARLPRYEITGLGDARRSFVDDDNHVTLGEWLPLDIPDVTIDGWSPTVFGSWESRWIGGASKRLYVVSARTERQRDGRRFHWEHIVTLEQIEDISDPRALWESLMDRIEADFCRWRRT
jgi:hypothetical protein